MSLGGVQWEPTRMSSELPDTAGTATECSSGSKRESSTIVFPRKGPLTLGRLFYEQSQRGLRVNFPKSTSQRL